MRMCGNCDHFITDDSDIPEGKGRCSNYECLWDGLIRSDVEGSVCPDHSDLLNESFKEEEDV